jgi:protein gp37
MMQASDISWTDATWNVIDGCRRVSEGCRNCYAERMALRFSGPGKPYEGLVRKRLVVVDGKEQSHAQWTGESRFHVDRLCLPLSWRIPKRIFVNSMSDLFFEDLDDEQIAAVFGVMAAAGRHTFQILTKRASRMRDWFAWLANEARECNGGQGMTPAARCFVAAQNIATHGQLEADLVEQWLSDGYLVTRALTAPWPLPNVWLGVSCEDQAAANERVPYLLKVPAAIRFLSCEPLLGPIDLFHVHTHEYNSIGAERFVNALDGIGHPNVDWVIAGCESGPRCRPCDYRWLRSLRDQCDLASVRFFLKQATAVGSVATPDDADDPEENALRSSVGEPIVHGIDKDGFGHASAPKRKGGNVIERPYLDGKQHLEFPAARVSA